MFHPQGPTFFELAQQALSSTERGYDLLAPKFDRTPFRTPDWILNEVATGLERISPFESVLDVCCGTGAAMQSLMPLCRNRMVGIDISHGMLQAARDQLDLESEEPCVELIRCDALEMPFESEFDLAVCFGALGHFLKADQPRLIHQVAKALKPGGSFAFVTSYLPAYWSHRFWLSRGFNAAMRVRNLLVRPPFIMYYLTFLLPDVRAMLETEGLRVEHESPIDRSRGHLRLVVATRQ